MKKVNNNSNLIVDDFKKHEGYGKIDFIGKVGLFGGISVILTVAALIYLAVHGINYGIDFKGGTEMQIKFDGAVTIDQLRDSIKDMSIGEVGVQTVGDGNEYVIRFQGEKGKTDKETNELLNSSIASVKEKINKNFGDKNPDFRRVDTVGPQVGGELKRSGLLAMFYCLLVILIYVAIRFDYNYSPGAVACLFHDAVITLAIYILVGKEVNIPIMAAILTLIGFSLNDTIVVFDRIRETEHKFRREGFGFIINKSINDMLGRTLITSGTVFVSSLCLYFFAGGVVSDIAFALCIGILFGTYSSIYVAAPTILIVNKLTAKPALA